MKVSDLKAKLAAAGSAGAKVSLTVYHETKRLVDRISNEGWRRCFGWIGVYLFAGISYRIVHGLPLTDLAAVISALGVGFGAVIVRGVEKYAANKIGMDFGARGPGAELGAT